MRRVVVLQQAADDLEIARAFYNLQEEGVGDHCVASLLSDIEKLAILHGVHREVFGWHRMLAERFPFGIYYSEHEDESQVVAVLDLRRDPNWIRNQLLRRRD